MIAHCDRHLRASCRVWLLATAAAGFIPAGEAVADSILDPGVYRLHNHPDAINAPPGYGLRLDELANLTPWHDVFTFNFDHPQSEVWLDYDGESIHIFGTVFGGLDVGSHYHPLISGRFAIDFTYENVTDAPGDDDLWVAADGPQNSGSITPLFIPGISVPLFDYAGDFPFTFRLGNESDDQGHRGFEGISGWGWLNHHHPDHHVSASDWLFTLEAMAIPLPPAVLLGAAGLGLAGIGRRFVMRRL